MGKDDKIDTELYTGPYDAVPVLRDDLTHDGVVSVAEGLDPGYPHCLSLRDLGGLDINIGTDSGLYRREILALLKRQKGNLSHVIITQAVEEFV